jgi:uncharacterized protein with PQ loop repeat
MAQTLGWVATVLFTLCYVPQIVKTMQTRTLDGVSVSLFVIAFVANAVAFAYATLIGQSPLQVKYAAALVIIGILLTVFFVCGRRAQNSNGDELRKSPHGLRLSRDHEAAGTSPSPVKYN